MPRNSVMTYDKKVRFGGWNHPDYKYVRAKLERFWRSEEEASEDEVDNFIAPLGGNGIVK